MKRTHLASWVKCLKTPNSAEIFGASTQTCKHANTYTVTAERACRRTLLHTGTPALRFNTNNHRRVHKARFVTKTTIDLICSHQETGRTRSFIYNSPNRMLTSLVRMTCWSVDASDQYCPLLMVCKKKFFTPCLFVSCPDWDESDMNRSAQQSKADKIILLTSLKPTD